MGHGRSRPMSSWDSPEICTEPDLAGDLSETHWIHENSGMLQGSFMGNRHSPYPRRLSEPRNWISPGIMGKILEDIRMEFCNQFPEQHSLNGVQPSLQNPSLPIPCQALPSHSNIGLSIPPSSSNGISAPNSPMNAEANDQLVSATMDHLEPMDSHSNDLANTVQAHPPGN